MKHFTLTLLAILQCCCLDGISCMADDDAAAAVAADASSLHDAAQLSALDLLKVNANNSTERSSSSVSNNNSSEKKSHRDQRTLNRRAGGHLRIGEIGASKTTAATTTTAAATTAFEPAQSTTESSREIVYSLNSNIKNQKSYFRRKTKTIPAQSSSSGSDRDVNESSSSSNSSNNKAVSNVATLDDSKKKSKDFIETTNDDENSLDYGLMILSAAGEGVSSSNTRDTKSDDSKKDESKKTLSDQIAEGKYGLIEKELFSDVPKAPGIISYKTNSETPNDNEKTLGGLNKDEIWLAEDHLLVLKGGLPNDRKNNEQDWRPIDDYEAPKRPVKIPLNPRVPPPFPVQLTKDGPLQFIGHNQFSLFNPFTNETGLFTNVDGSSPDFRKANGGDKTNLFAGPGATRNFTQDQVHDVVAPPPWLFHNTYKDTDLLKHFPFNLPLPDQALNRTEEFDEDDPSLFYPPPYSFVYKINHTNLAPVGPLVPGLILPPPPDFFSVYDPDENKRPVKTPIDAINRIKEFQLNNQLTAPTVKSTSVTPKVTTYAPMLRDFTRKPKVQPTPQSVRTAKVKSSTTLRPTTTILRATTPKDESSKKYYPVYDTTTLKLHPVYVPTIQSTRIYTTSTPASTTAAPAEAPLVRPSYKQDYGTQAHPIYFEYFDARTANPIRHQYIGPEYDHHAPSPVYLQTTSSTTPSPPISNYKHATTKGHSKKPKSFYPPQFISSTISPSPYPENIDSKYLFVTQRPEIYGSVIASPQPYPISTEHPPSLAYNSVQQQKPLVLKPVGKFEDEIHAIRQTLDYYGGGSINNNGKKFPQKPPKVKAVYEFSFEAANKHHNRNPEDYQQQNNQFASSKPEINYSQLSELIKTNSYFPTSTETPVKYYRTKQSATLPQKSNNSPTETSAAQSPMPAMVFGQKLRPQNLNYYVRPIQYKEVVSSPSHQPQSQKIISYSSYDPSQLQIPADQGYRINNRNVKYRKPPQQSQQQQQQTYYGPASEVASLINDTVVNYRQPQKPINPYSEFIDVQRFPQNSPQLPPPQLQPNYHHPAFGGFPIQRPFPNQQQQQHHHQQQQQHHHQQQQQQQSYNHQVPLDLVKFEYPQIPQIPQINPDSVHITFYNRPMEKSDATFYDPQART